MTKSEEHSIKPCFTYIKPETRSQTKQKKLLCEQMKKKQQQLRNKIEQRLYQRNQQKLLHQQDQQRSLHQSNRPQRLTFYQYQPLPPSSHPPQRIQKRPRRRPFSSYTDDEILLKVVLGFYGNDVTSVKKIIPWLSGNELNDLINEIQPRDIPELKFPSHPNTNASPPHENTPEYRDWLLQAQWSLPEIEIYKTMTGDGKKGLKHWRKLERRLYKKDLADIVKHFGTLEIMKG